VVIKRNLVSFMGSTLHLQQKDQNEKLKLSLELNVRQSVMKNTKRKETKKEKVFSTNQQKNIKTQNVLEMKFVQELWNVNSKKIHF
jgi:hypothetical protein